MRNAYSVASLPEPPLLNVDVPTTEPREAIPQAELLAAFSAYHTFQIARADYEKKRATVTLKLLLCADPEPGAYTAELDQDGIAVVTGNWSEPPDVCKLYPA